MAIEVPCCPELEKHPCCNRLDFKYRLEHRVDVGVAEALRGVIVEVTILVRMERCPGPLTLGELAYTTTLLPGEKVRLFTSDRRSRFSYDTSSKLSYRHAQTSEDSFYMSSVAREMTDLTIVERGTSSSHSWGDWGADMHAYYGSAVFVGGAGGSIDGHYDDRSTHDFVRALSSHAESSHYRAQMATHTSSSISVGEVATRSHAEGESEDQYESASRVFANPNHCHAVSFFFWRINRVQTMKFSLVAIERRVIDPAAPTNVDSRPPLLATGVSVMPTSILGTAADRLEVEARARQSAAAKLAEAERGPAQPGAGTILTFARTQRTQPLPAEARDEALKRVDERLVTAGLIDHVGGNVSDKIVKEISWERELCLPTPGILVKGCLDDCDICEPVLQEELAIGLERKKLENELLKKQIELLEKSQEYRCCPEGSVEEPVPTP